MDMLKSYNSDDEFINMPTKIENYEQAEKVFKLILKLSKEKLIVDGLADGLAYGFLAGFCEDPHEIVKNSQKSVDILEKNQGN